jgi:hypothetical protein
MTAEEHLAEAAKYAALARDCDHAALRDLLLKIEQSHLSLASTGKVHTAVKADRRKVGQTSVLPGAAWRSPR